MLPMQSESWRAADSGNCWERVYRLSLRIKHTESSKDIKSRLISEIKAGSEIMAELANLLLIGPMEKRELNEVGMCLLEAGKVHSGFHKSRRKENFIKRIFNRILRRLYKGRLTIEPKDYALAHELFRMAQAMFSKSSCEEMLAETRATQSWLYQCDGDRRMADELGVQLGALYSYQDALKTIRKIPLAEREKYEVEKK